MRGEEFITAKMLMERSAYAVCIVYVMVEININI